MISADLVSFTFPGRGDKHSPMKWNYNHFTGVDYDDKTGTKAIYMVRSAVQMNSRW